MYYIPLLFVLLAISTVGCASNSLEELAAEAKVCVAQSTNELGVIGASPEQRTACWVAYNEKIEVVYERDERKRAEKEYNEYYIRLCYPGYPVFESWGGRDTRFKGCWGKYY